MKASINEGKSWLSYKQNVKWLFYENLTSESASEDFKRILTLWECKVMIYENFNVVRVQVIPTGANVSVGLMKSFVASTFERTDRVGTGSLGSTHIICTFVNVCEKFWVFINFPEVISQVSITPGKGE